MIFVAYRHCLKSFDISHCLVYKNVLCMSLLHDTSCILQQTFTDPLQWFKAGFLAVKWGWVGGPSQYPEFVFQ